MTLSSSHKYHYNYFHFTLLRGCKFINGFINLSTYQEPTGLKFR